MTVRRRIMAADEFYDRLRRNDFTPATGLTGMVRLSERQDAFQLSVDSCETWIEIPLDAIREAEFLGRRACGDHFHQVARIGLKDAAASDSWEFRLLSGLLPFIDETVAPEAIPDAGTNPCQDCVRRCHEFVGDAERFRDCVTRCPC